MHYMKNGRDGRLEVHSHYLSFFFFLLSACALDNFDRFMQGYGFIFGSLKNVQIFSKTEQRQRAFPVHICRKWKFNGDHIVVTFERVKPQ